MDKILKAREARSKLILDNFSEDNNVIIVKANVFGSNKSPFYAYIVIGVFLRLVKDNIKVDGYKFYESNDGPFYLIKTKVDLVEAKTKLIELENNHELGRLVDLDIYSQGGSISRRDLNKGFRKCLICDEIALVCMRNKTHSFDELSSKVDQTVRDYLTKFIKKVIDEAITLEAKLDPKFGLVTSKSNGSHKDMSFDLLMKSKVAIIDDLVEMFFLGFDNELLTGFSKARTLGLKTEEKMFNATNNINTYKGLIFILGIVLVTLGYSLKNNRRDIFSQVKLIGKDLLIEFKEEVNTFGMYAYREFGFLGARGEVANGLQNVKLVKNYLNNFNDEELTLVLIKLIRNVEDTVLLKRSKTLNRYNYFKNLVGNIETYNLEKITEITNECINNNISFGGSADLLIASIFLRLVEREMVIKYE